MNLMVKQFDRVGRAVSLAWLNPARLGRGTRAAHAARGLRDALDPGVRRDDGARRPEQLSSGPDHPVLAVGVCRRIASRLRQPRTDASTLLRRRIGVVVQRARRHRRHVTGGGRGAAGSVQAACGKASRRAARTCPPPQGQPATITVTLALRLPRSSARRAGTDSRAHGLRDLHARLCSRGTWPRVAVASATSISRAGMSRRIMRAAADDLGRRLRSRPRA